MKFANTILILSCLIFVNCREKVIEKRMIPVDSDSGMGDGAPSLDSLLKYETPSVISEENRDTLTTKQIL